MEGVPKQTPDQVVPASPYRGIHPFRFIDQKYYFGREEITRELVYNVLLYRLVVIFGESGAGKSSLINAGLVPALKAKGFQPERLRVRPFKDQPLLIERIDVGETVESGFLPSIFARDEVDRVPENSALITLKNFHDSINEAIQNQYPTLIFDQFEELFTLFGNRRVLQLRVLNTIARLASDPKLKVKIILSIREDFLGKLQILNRRYPQVLDHRIRLALLTRENARQAILSPFEPTNPFAAKLSPDLAERIIDDLSATQSDRTIPPTQLQIICSRLWDTYAGQTGQIGLPHFEAMGGVTGIIKAFLSSELQLFTGSQRRTAVEILAELITDSNTRDVVSKEKIRDLAAEDKNSSQVSTILETLEKRRLINQVSQRGTYYFELSSEFLVEPVQKELAHLKEERQRKRARIAFWCLVALSLGTIVGFVWYNSRVKKQTQELRQEVAQAQEKATEIATDAETKTSANVRLIENVKKLDDDDPQIRTDALSDIRTQAQQGQVLEAWLPIIEGILRVRTPEARTREYMAELKRDVAERPAASPTPTPDTATLPIRIYMQISDQNQRATAEEIKKKLATQNILVPNIQLVRSRSANNVLKYYKKEESDNNNVNKIINLLKSYGLNVRASYVQGYEDATQIRPKHYELLFEAPPERTPSPSTETTLRLKIDNVEVDSYSRVIPGQPAVLVLNIKGRGFSSRLQASPRKVFFTALSDKELILSIPDPAQTEVISLRNPITGEVVQARIDRPRLR
jgi:hypothetical protein